MWAGSMVTNGDHCGVEQLQGVSERLSPRCRRPGEALAVARPPVMVYGLFGPQPEISPAALGPPVGGQRIKQLAAA